MSRNEPPEVLKITIEEIERSESEAAARRGAAPRHRNPLAKLSLALGVLSLFFAGLAVGPVAIFCGVVAATRARGRNGEGQGLAIGGILLGLLGCILWVFLVWYFFEHRPPRSDEPEESDRIRRNVVRIETPSSDGWIRWH